MLLIIAETCILEAETGIYDITIFFRPQKALISWRYRNFFGVQIFWFPR
jgi:hypothetical protein